MSGGQEPVVLMLPPVELDHLDRVLTSAGPRVPAAMAVLVSALGWLIVNGAKRGDWPLLVRGVARQLEQAVALHESSRGLG